jgi:hypothetical protein
MTKSCLVFSALLFASCAAWSQTDPPLSSIPNVIKFTGSVVALDGKPMSGEHEFTFSLFTESIGGTPIWTETLTVILDDRGCFNVLLGSTHPEGIPPALFGSRQTQWVEVTPDDGVERPRVALTTVPYAFKATDADSLGGKTPSEYVSKDELSLLLSSMSAFPPARLPIPFPTNPVMSKAGAFEATSPIGPSFVSDATTGSPFVVESSALVQNLNADFLHGLTDTAFAKLQDTNTFGALQTFSQGTTFAGTVPEVGVQNVFDSAPLIFQSIFTGPQTTTPITQQFSWNSQPVLGSTGTPTAMLSLSFGTNSTPSTKTGLSISSNGTINFAPGQQFPTQAILDALSGNQTGGSTPGNTANNSPIVQTNQYPWTETITTSHAITVGFNEIKLTPCPRGVNGKDVWHYLYISGTGAPEEVLITGGSCTSGATIGTIQFTAAYAHPSGYQIGTASDGIQEAFIDAVEPNTFGRISRSVVISPGTHLLRARVTIAASSIQINSSGATLTCAMKDTCVMAGTPGYNGFQQIVLNGLRLTPGIVGGTWPALEDNAQGTQINDFGPGPSSTSGTSFGSLVQVDNDQAASINTLNSNLAAWSRCDWTFCSTAIIAPGPFGTNAGVLWVQNANLPLECAANGIDNHDSNTLRITNSVIEGYAEFGIRSSTAFVQQNVQISGGYTEVGNCISPLGTGQAGLIVENGQANVTATVGPQGILPQFANTGSTRYSYYVVVNSSTLGTSVPFLAGYAMTSGVGRINVQWNKVGKQGAITYDILRVAGTDAPYGTGSFAVATGIPASSCLDNFCTFVDNAASAPSSYTALTVAGYWPSLFLWPGNVILTSDSDVQNNGGLSPTQLYTDSIPEGSDIVVSAGAIGPSVFAQECEPGAGGGSVIWIQCLGGNALSNNNPAVTATILQLSTNQASPGGYKGRLIFETPPLSGIPATEVITLADCNPSKTLTSPNIRPSWDPCDTYIGYDQPTGADAAHTQLSLGAPVSISQYIKNTGDSVHWGERLTNSAKLFQVPVFANSGLTVNGPFLANGPCQGFGCGAFSTSGTQVADLFNETTSGPLSSNWIVTAGSWTIGNNQATFVGGSSDGSALAAYAGASFPANQRASGTVIYGPGGSTAIGVGVRMSSTTESGYVCVAFAAGTLFTGILKFSQGAHGGVGVGFGPGLPSGDTLGITVEGNTITCYDNGIPIPGLTATDNSSPLTGGYPGIFGAYGYPSFIANFGAGDVAYTANGPTALTALTQASQNAFGSSCTMSGTTTCTVPITASYAVPLCQATVQGSNPIASACAFSGGIATVTAANPNSATWAVLVFGNPN